MIPPIARRFVAGEERSGAIEQAAAVNADGRGAILNLLGESTTDRDQIAEDARTYRRLIDDIAASDLDASISVKPTQLGLGIDQATFQTELLDLLSYADDPDIFVWIDMERSDTTDETIAVFKEAVASHPHDVGMCLQANLRRTPEDIAELAGLPGAIRIVKGAYNEPATIAYQSKSRVDEAYRAAMEALFRSAIEPVAVATHDPEMIAYAEQLHVTHGTPFEFQMLMGVAESRQRELAQRHRVVQYIPYGPRWFSYFTRRVLERSENLKFAVRAVVGK